MLPIGRLDLAIYAAFGAFTGIYARNESPRARFLRQSLAGGILTLLRHPDQRQQLGAAAQMWAQAHDADWTAHTFEALYESLRAQS